MFTAREASMNRVLRSAVVVAGLVFMLGGAASWGQVPSGNDTSDANRNTGGGTGALVNVTPALPPSPNGSDNTAYGAYTLNATTGGSNNTAVGSEALFKNKLGSFATAVGAFALFNTTNGLNTAVGYSALKSNTAGAFNTALGLNALLSNTGDQDTGSGSDNTATGANALNRNSTGSGNTATGHQALYNTTTGYYNTATGWSVLAFNTTGSYNTALGYRALYNSTGTRNTALGYNAGYHLTSGDFNIYLGNTGQASESATMRLGSVQTRTFIVGIVGVPISGAMVTINNAGQLGIVASSARYKRDIRDMREGSQGVYQLRPVTFQYKQDAQGIRQYGLIAEEVAKVYPELVTKGADGKVESVQYHELIPMLLNEVQRQQQEVIALKAQNERFQALVEQMQQRDEEQREQNAALAARLERLEQRATHTATATTR
jgi:hypothetical protein